MGGACLCCSWTCRPVWPLFFILASVPCMLHCTESPAAVVGKMYPRGNHWAVGHLMGKKSIESLPELQEANHDSEYLTSTETDQVTGRFQHLIEALLQPKNQKQTPNRLPSSWREEGGDNLREMSELLLLALKLQDSDST
ncbi:gastrin-releasing peptide [Parambassis ranga]|uniref:Gastrin-releasing peptide n=1 Tax=Parambassis ranga TaxID=210632 RepID=A0A6P7JBK5_9TELE|nr:gastrin-releasing peptide [Parambassis ranga]